MEQIILMENILKIKIPLPPIEHQNKIVEEINSYQKIIDGCRQVVENYKPNFIIKEKWENMKIKDIAKLIYGLGNSIR